MDYAASVAGDEVLRTAPFEHTFRQVTFGELVQRLAAERGLFTSGVCPLEGGRRAATLVVGLVEGDDARALARTLRLWSLQSCPAVSAVVATRDARAVAAARDTLQRDGLRDVPVVGPEGDPLAPLDRSDWLVFARPGDLVHPSAVATLALARAAGDPWDVAVWNSVERGPGGELALLYRPALERHTLRHVDYVGRAFAVAASWVRRFPHDLLDHLVRNDLHLLHLWLAERTDARWHVHPEAFTVLAPRRPGAGAADRRARVLPFLDTYRDLLAPAGSPFRLVVEEGREAPYRLEPVRAPRGTSVVISFRDRPDVTCETLRALFGQRLPGSLEVVLVDNGSRPESAAQVLAFAAANRGPATVKALAWPGPFNHSRQCALGVEASSGEVCVFLSNDARLLSPEALDHMGRWALVDGVGTVGCRVVAPDGSLVAAGLAARPPGRLAVHHALWEESPDARWACDDREAAGNTFACAAVARATIERVGPLDALGFPNGTNDVEYSLRMRAAGYRHIYLGHVAVQHVPQATRRACDETPQNLRLRLTYPAVLWDGLLQLRCEAPGRLQRLAVRLSGTRQWVLARPGLARPLRALWRLRPRR